MDNMSVDLDIDKILDKLLEVRGHKVPKHTALTE